MDNKLIKYRKKTIQNFFRTIWNRIKTRFLSPQLWDMETEDLINANLQLQDEEKTLLEDLLSRNQYLLETLDIRMLDKKMLELFDKSLLERIVADSDTQKEILELSDDKLKFYSYLLNYNVTDKKERITNISSSSLRRNIDFDELQRLNHLDKTKAISILLSDSEFKLYDLSKLDNYYEKRRNACKKIIDNPQIIEEYDYDTYWEKVNNGEDIDIEWGIVDEMQPLNTEDRIRYAIIEAKYGMSLNKAKELCKAFGKDIDKIEQTEETRIIKELKQILYEKDIENLRKIELSENIANYEGTLNIVPNLRNSYLHEYQKTLYQVKDEDYIGTQEGIKIYNALGKNNENSEFNMILTSIGGIYQHTHDFSDIKKDWDRADSNHTISCSYIGNDFLGFADVSYLLGFADVKDNELIHSRNQDAGFGEENRFKTYAKNEFLVPKNQINTSKWYNEMVIERKIDKDGKLINRKPTYAIFLAENLNDINDEKNNGWQTTKRMARELDIPIVVIDVQKCMELEWNKTQEMIKLIKEQKRMDLIPEVIYKIENNRGSNSFPDIRKEIFSDSKIKDGLEQIIGTIMTSSTQIANQGIEEFVKVTKGIMQNYKEHLNNSNKEYETYDYQGYIERLKVLFGLRNGLFNTNEKKQNNENLSKQNTEKDKNYL